MKKLVAVLCLSASYVLALTPLATEAKVLSVYPHQLKGWATSGSWDFTFGAEYLYSDQADFMCPVNLPIGSRATHLKAWMTDMVPFGLMTEGGWVRLIRVKDGVTYNQSTDDLAFVQHVHALAPAWTLLVDTTADGPASARIAAGYRYYLYVHTSNDAVGTVQIVYTTP